MDEIRFGVIGIGNMGSAHAMHVYRGDVAGLKLTAVCDIEDRRLKWAKEQFGEAVTGYVDYQKLITSGEVDAILIATPHILHPEISIAGLRADLHVLTEKPAGIDTASVRRMNQAAKESRGKFAIMYNQRTNPLYKRIREIVMRGELGEIKRFVWIVNNWYRTQSYYDSGDWRATWNGEGGGVLLNQCPHNLDIWQWIMGMPTRVRAFCRKGHYHRIQVEDDVTIYAEYANGANAVFISSTGEYPGTNRMEISGTRGKAVIENGKLTLQLLQEDERILCKTSTESMPTPDYEQKVIEQKPQKQDHLLILENFADAIRKGKELIAPGIEGINGLTISNAAYLSQWTDDWVTLPIDEQKFLSYLKKEQDMEGKIAKQHPAVEKYGEYSERWNVRW